MRRSEVVLVDWPYSKLRPAVVVQADFLNGVIDDTVLVQITGTRHGLPGTEVEIRPVDEPNSGLLKTSYVSGTNIMTADQLLIDKTIGYLSDATMLQITDCLRVVLEL